MAQCRLWALETAPQSLTGTRCWTARLRHQSSLRVTRTASTGGGQMSVVKDATLQEGKRGRRDRQIMPHCNTSLCPT